MKNKKESGKITSKYRYFLLNKLLAKIDVYSLICHLANANYQFISIYIQINHHTFGDGGKIYISQLEHKQPIEKYYSLW